MRRIAIGLALLVAALPVQARACTALAGWQFEANLPDPEQPGITGAEREQRLQAQRVWLEARQQAQVAEWQELADQGLGDSDLRHAADLIEVILPPPVAVRTATCNPPFPYYSDPNDTFWRELRRQLPMPVGDREGRSAQLADYQAFSNRYQALAHGCRAEYRDRLDGWLLGKLHSLREGDSREALARVWHTVARLGFLERNQDGPRIMFTLTETGELQMIDDPEFAPFNLLAGVPEDPRGAMDRLLATTNWAEMQRYWREDPDARAVLAAIEETYATVARPGQPYDGLCPRTLGNVQNLARAQLLLVQRTQTDALEAFLETN